MLLDVCPGVYLDFAQRGGGISIVSEGELVSEVGGALNTSVMITGQCANYKQQEAYRPTKHRQLLDSAKIVCSISVLKIKLCIMVNHTAVYYVCIQQTSSPVFDHAISYRPSI